MTALWELTATEAAARIRAGEITSEALVASCLERTAARDDAVKAWVWLEPALALDAARAADAAQTRGVGTGPLHGVPVAIKDIIGTADMPTQNGYVPHAGRHTRTDAFCVSQLRDAGAIILGKTVTTELATRTPGPTANPHNRAHTPGGSSSGSAAAVADGQVPLALGTQTGGSVIRPASFCGIHALKPTFGLIGRSGVTVQADWLDTVGVYGRSVEDLALIGGQLLARDPGDPQAVARSRPDLGRFAAADPERAPRLAYWRTPKWDRADAGAQTALDAFAAGLGGACTEIALPDWIEQAWDWQRILQLYGNAHHYGPLADAHGEGMSEDLRKLIDEGRGMTETAYRHALAERARVQDALAEIHAEYDAILSLSAAGPAPEGLGFTGDPVFNAFWTYSGAPCVSLPLLSVDGLPLGVQLSGAPGADGPLLRTARWLETRA